MPLEIHRRDVWLLSVILLAGLLLRIVYLMEISGDPSFRHPIYDPEYNAYWARGIATGDWTLPPGVEDPEIRTTPHGRPPGYPWFLAAVYLLFGVGDLAPRIVQMAIGLINAILMYLLARRLFGRATGFFAGFFMAIYWVFPYFEGILTYPSVAVLALLCMLHLLLVWHDTLRMPWAAGAGLLLGIFGLFRPNGLLLLPLLMLWMLWAHHGRRKGRILGGVAAAFLVFAGVAVAIAPAFVRNYLVARDTVFLSSYGGINLYVGNHPDASLVEPRIPELMRLAGIENWSCFDYPRIVRGVAAELGRERLRFSEANRYFYQKALAFVWERPFDFLVNMCKKFLLFWGPYEITNDTVMEYDKAFSKTLCHLPRFPWVLALFVWGSLICLYDMRRRSSALSGRTKEIVYLLWLLIAGYCLSVILYFVAGRYRVPMIPLLLIFGAYGAGRCASWIAGQSWRAAGVALIALVLLYTGASMNPTGYVPNRGTWHLRKALAWSTAGKEDRAFEQYLAALAYGAESSLVYANLGRLRMEQGDTAEGMRMYEEGLRLNPNNAVIHNNLGYALYVQGDRDRARMHFEKAVGVNARFSLAHMNLGNLLADLGNYAEAKQHFRNALSLNPQEPAVRYNIARMRFELGDIQGAVEEYLEVIEESPDFAEALNNLGYAYEALGKLDEAMALYRRAIAADSGFMLAYNNLGSLLLRLKDWEGAYAVFGEATAKAPENAHAWFNLGRLQVLRGERQQAEAGFRRALAIDSDHYDAMIQLGCLLLEKGDIEEARGWLEKAIEGLPDNAQARQCLEMALEAMGASEKAADQSSGPQNMGTNNPASKTETRNFVDYRRAFDNEYAILLSTHTARLAVFTRRKG